MKIKGRCLHGFESCIDNSSELHRLYLHDAGSIYMSLNCIACGEEIVYLSDDLEG